MLDLALFAGMLHPPEGTMTIRRWFLLSLTIASTLTIGCTDKAKADYEACEDSEAKNKFDDAVKACELAYSKDPESKYGKLAQAKQPVLRREADEYYRKRSTLIAELSGNDNNLRQQQLAAQMKVNMLKQKVAAATDETSRGQLQTQLAEAQKNLNALMQGGTGAKPCKCQPDDPLCSCL